MLPIPIVYEEPHFLLVNKPAALFSQAAAGIDSLQARLIAQLKARDQHPGEPFVGLPHRLDRGTSGIMLIARNQRALKRFGQQFQSRKVVKHYLAVVEGAPVSADAGGAHGHGDSTQIPLASSVLQSGLRWEDYLRKIADVPQAEVVSADTEGAKLAVARVDWLCSASAEHVATQSLLKIQLETGRMHQIRVQAASRGWPVVGDASYGARLPWSSGSQGSPTSDTHGHPPIALHAWSLEFRHPQTAKAMRCVAPVPDNWQQLPSEIQACIAGLD